MYIYIYIYMYRISIYTSSDRNNVLGLAIAPLHLDGPDELLGSQSAPRVYGAFKLQSFK